MRRAILNLVVALSLVALSLVALLGHAVAQPAWPALKPIRMVIPSGPGGGADLFSRPLADFLSKELKQQVVVENRPGANGIVAHEAVVRQPPDGYTVLISFSAAIIANPLMQPKMSHDPLKDFKPVAMIGGGGGNLIIVNPELPVRNLKELIAYVKGKKGDASYGSWGIASGGHLVIEMLKTRTGMEISHVPYKTVSQIPPDVVSGVLGIATIDSASALPFIKSGRIRAIATMGEARLPQTADVPTLKEQGVDYNLSPVYGLYAPTGTPKAIVDALNAATNKWLALPDTIQYFEQRQNAPKPEILSVEAFAAKQERDITLWRKLIEDSKVVLQ
jgi:tripartite-type tricarboxylate transporter receptor subunit TctC